MMTETGVDTQQTGPNVKTLKKWLSIADGFFFMGGGFLIAAIVIIAVIFVNATSIIFIILGVVFLSTGVSLYIWTRRQLPQADKMMPFAQVATTVRRSFRRRLSTHRQRQEQRRNLQPVDNQSPAGVHQETDNSWKASTDREEGQNQSHLPPPYQAAILYPKVSEQREGPLKTLRDEKRNMAYPPQTNMPPPPTPNYM